MIYTYRALGCVVYEMATSTKLFRGKTDENTSELIKKFDSQVSFKQVRDIQSKEISPSILNLIYK